MCLSSVLLPQPEPPMMMKMLPLLTLKPMFSWISFLP